jgi:hypothetical protein
MGGCGRCTGGGGRRREGEKGIGRRAVEEDVLTGRQQVEAELLGPPGLGGETAGRFRLADHDA